MTVSLGVIALHDSLFLDGLEAGTRRAMSTNRTLGGRQVVMDGPELPGGRVLTLSGENLFTLAQLSSLGDLWAASGNLTLVHHRGTFSVRITAMTPEPTFKDANPDDTAWYSASITLLEV